MSLKSCRHITTSIQPASQHDPVLQFVIVKSKNAAPFSDAVWVYIYIYIHIWFRVNGDI